MASGQLWRGFTAGLAAGSLEDRIGGVSAYLVQGRLSGDLTRVTRKLGSRGATIRYGLEALIELEGIWLEGLVSTVYHQANACALTRPERTWLSEQGNDESELRSDQASSLSCSVKSTENLRRSGGVGPLAKGYSLVSSDSKARGCRMKTGGKERFVVVVVVMVLVSTHSATSYCSLETWDAEFGSSWSSKLTVRPRCARGRLTSVVF